MIARKEREITVLAADEKMADNNGNADAGEAGNNRENVAPNGMQINARDRLFHAIFIKAAAVYIRVCPKWCRALLEVVILAKVK